MSNIPHLPKQTIFEPRHLEAMTRALDDACSELKIFDAESRKTIAVRILDLAGTGLVEAKTLKIRILREAKLSPFGD